VSIAIVATAAVAVTIAVNVAAVARLRTAAALHRGNSPECVAERVAGAIAGFLALSRPWQRYVVCLLLLMLLLFRLLLMLMMPLPAITTWTWTWTKTSAATAGVTDVTVFLIAVQPPDATVITLSYRSEVCNT
jgi:hypothetical protein